MKDYNVRQEVSGLSAENPLDAAEMFEDMREDGCFTSFVVTETKTGESYNVDTLTGVIHKRETKVCKGLAAARALYAWTKDKDAVNATDPDVFETVTKALEPFGYPYIQALEKNLGIKP